MYLADRITLCIIDILYIIIVILGVTKNIISVIAAVILLIIIALCSITYIAIRDDIYKKDMHNNLERIANRIEEISENLKK